MNELTTKYIDRKLDEQARRYEKQLISATDVLEAKVETNATELKDFIIDVLEEQQEYLEQLRDELRIPDRVAQLEKRVRRLESAHRE